MKKQSISKRVESSLDTLQVEMEALAEDVGDLLLIASYAKRWVKLEDRMTDSDDHICPPTEICAKCGEHHEEYKEIFNFLKKATRRIEC